MAGKVNPIPAGYHSVTPYLVLDDANGAIEFYKKAFGAKELARMNGPGGKVGHAEIKIGDSIVMVADEMPGPGPRSARKMGGSPVGLYLYVEDVDSVFNRAVGEGAKPDMPPRDMFWGDRYGKLTDPYGHQWSLATHVEDIQPQEMEKRAREFMEKMAQGASQSA